MRKMIGVNVTIIVENFFFERQQNFTLNIFIQNYKPHKLQKQRQTTKKSTVTINVIQLPEDIKLNSVISEQNIHLKQNLSDFHYFRKCQLKLVNDKNNEAKIYYKLKQGKFNND